MHLPPVGNGARLNRGIAAAGVLSLTILGGSLHAQAAVDPNVAPRAAALERQGERQLATDMLGRYLATAPDDGQAWFQLGRFYRIDAAEWHIRGHVGDPPGPLYLDFAATALDQAARLMVDSGVVFRGLVEVDRALVFVEDSGWTATRERMPWGIEPEVPAYIIELGANLLHSCPKGGVLLTGDDLETLGVWYGAIVAELRDDVVPLRPRLYATDPVYRGQMARALDVDSALTVQEALKAVADDRPVCLTPGADSAALPDARWVPIRLVRVSRPEAEPTSDVLTLTEYVRAAREDGSPWVEATREVYFGAARYNGLLCVGLLSRLGDPPPPSCGQ